jgi:hypothetical protein
MNKNTIALGIAHVISGSLAQISIVKQTQQLKRHNYKLSMIALASTIIQTSFIIIQIRRRTYKRR